MCVLGEWSYIEDLEFPQCEGLVGELNKVITTFARLGSEYVCVTCQSDFACSMYIITFKKLHQV